MEVRPASCYHVNRPIHRSLSLSDLVEALTDPKGFRADLEKRQKQMEAMGIKREDIGEVLPARKQGSKVDSRSQIISTTSDKPANSSGAQTPLSSSNSQSTHGSTREEKGMRMTPPTCRPGSSILALSERQETKMAQIVEAIKVDELRKDKSYVKMLKKHQKDLDELRKRHAKERTLIQKQQCAAVEKLVADKDKNFLKPGSTSALTQRRSSNGSLSTGRSGGSNSHRPISPCTSDTPDDAGGHDDRLRSLIVQQTHDYSGLTRRQREEEHRLVRSQMEADWELLEKLLDEAHKRQFSQLKHQLEM